MWYEEQSRENSRWKGAEWDHKKTNVQKSQEVDNVLYLGTIITFDLNQRRNVNFPIPETSLFHCYLSK